MPNLSIKSVPEALAESLRQRAARNHRSLQGELMAILESAVAEAAPTPVDWRSRLLPLNSAQRGRLSAEDIIAEHRRARPQTGQRNSSVALIRQMRDEHYGEAWDMAEIKDGPWPSQPDASEGGK